MFISLIPQKITKMLLAMPGHDPLVPLVGAAVGQVGHLHIFCAVEGVIHSGVILGAVE